MQRFQFPSNGKGFPNTYAMNRNEVWLSFNSLQTGKAFRTSVESHWEEPWVCFNSLQTGKAFRTVVVVSVSIVAKKFQFPSNGKGFPNDPQRQFWRSCSDRSFNSLQTGKAFRTRRIEMKNLLVFCFNSLQTGKAFRTHKRTNNKDETNNVSIPFKRERLSELMVPFLWLGITEFQFPSNGKGFPNIFLEF